MRRFVHTILAVCASTALYSQQAPNQPMELPEIVVEGSARVDIPGGSKEAPSRPPILSAAALDSLNPLQKTPLPRLPESSWPVYRPSLTMIPGWIQATLGNYLTPQVQGGYSFRADSYLIDLDAGIEASTGWQPNADYTKTHVGVRSSYVAPEKFLFFGGSLTTVDATLSHRTYALFSQPDAPRRSTVGSLVGIETSGTYEQVRYRGVAQWGYRSLNTVDRAVSGSILQGQAEIAAPWSTLEAGLHADLRMRSWNGNAYPSMEATVSLSQTSGNLQGSVRIGPQWVSTTAANDRFGVYVAASGSLAMSPDVTVSGTLHSGLRQRDHEQVYQENPYVVDSVEIDIPYDVVALEGSMQWQPSTTLGVSAGISFMRTERTPVWTRSTAGTFALDYLPSTTLQGVVDARWMVSRTQAVTADLRFTSTSVDTLGQNTYTPPVVASLGYEHQWTAALQTTIGLVYVSNRWADLEHQRQLSGYVDLQLDAEYRVLRDLGIVIQGRNLVGSTMFLWEGYRERSFFVSAGILWRL